MKNILEEGILQEKYSSLECSGLMLLILIPITVGLIVSTAT
jgi:hypothetical protein